MCTDAPRIDSERKYRVQGRDKWFTYILPGYATARFSKSLGTRADFMIFVTGADNTVTSITTPFAESRNSFKLHNTEGTQKQYFVHISFAEETSKDIVHSISYHGYHGNLLLCVFALLET